MDDPNEQLLQAMLTRNLPLVDQLLQLPDLNLNYRIEGHLTEGELSEAVSYAYNTDIFARLLNRSYNVKDRDLCGGTLLHFAVQYCPEIVHKLIERGADINAYDEYNRRPLSLAAFNGDLEIVCVLLYYGADVHGKGNSALLQAVLQGSLKPPLKSEVAKVLFSHTDLELSDLSCLSKYGATTLYMAVKHTSPTVVDLLSIMDTKNERCEELLELALRYDTAEVFRTMWNLFGDRVVIIPAFVIKCFERYCRFSNKEWLEVLNLLLNSPHTKNIYASGFINKLNFFHFMHIMLNCLSERGIEPDIRLDIITFFVSLGVQICEYDLNFVHRTFSFKDELRFLIFTYNYEQEVKPQLLHHELRTLFTLEIKRDIVYEPCVTPAPVVLQNPIFAIPQNDRSLTLRNIDWARRVERLNQVPEVPSLVEASRNEVMRTIIKIYNITKAYQYLEFVEKSNLPHLIKDMLLLKIKIY